jgi:hypothetical protein
MAKKQLTFTIDADVVDAIKPLAKAYGVNLSSNVNDLLFMILQQLRAVDKLSSDNPEGVPTDVARAYLKELISSAGSDSQALLDEHYPELANKKTKVKA